MKTDLSGSDAKGKVTMIMSPSTLLKSAALAATAAVAGMTSAHAATVSINTETGVAMETEFGIRGDTGTRGYELAGATIPLLKFRAGDAVQALRAEMALRLHGLPKPRE